MQTDGWKKFNRLLYIIKLFQERPCWSNKEIAEHLGIDGDTSGKYLKDLSYSGILPLRREKQNDPWCLMEGAVVPQLEISLSYPEAVSLYLAGRLLAQTQDEQNWHMSMALHKLLNALPASLQEQQQTLQALLLMEDTERPDFSNIFQVMANGWVNHLRVRLTYARPHGRSFETLFDPYLMEPSAIGRTVYIMGYSHLSKAPRVYKMERIQRAELTGQTFEPDREFKGEEKLNSSWTIMYSEEKPVRVRLRFTAEVTPRLRETRWHPSQEITLTRDGCEWSVMIGDTLEIEPWIRGWGADCEVLEPAELRTRVIKHIQRSQQVYGLASSPATPHDPTVFNRNLFRAKTEEE